VLFTLFRGPEEKFDFPRVRIFNNESETRIDMLSFLKRESERAIDERAREREQKRRNCINITPKWSEMTHNQLLFTSHVSRKCQKVKRLLFNHLHQCLSPVRTEKYDLQLKIHSQNDVYRIRKKGLHLLVNS